MLDQRRRSAPAIRYLIVGLASNALLFVIYIGLTAAGLRVEIASSLVYGLGIAITYLLNRNWSFASDRPHRFAVPAYIGAYGGGYMVQIGALVLLIRVGLPHALAQLMAMALAAAVIFATLRFGVFPARPVADGRSD